MTSDGITDEDWSRVVVLSGQVADAAIAGDDDAYARGRDGLLCVLDDLEAQYGPRPSIFLARAQYTRELRERQRLLHEGFDQAKHLGDPQAEVEIAAFLAKLYCDELRDRDGATTWADALETAIRRSRDNDHLGDLERIRGAIVDWR